MITNIVRHRTYRMIAKFCTLKLLLKLIKWQQRIIHIELLTRPMMMMTMWFSIELRRRWIIHRKSMSTVESTKITIHHRRQRQTRQLADVCFPIYRRQLASPMDRHYSIVFNNNNKSNWPMKITDKHRSSFGPIVEHRPRKAVGQNVVVIFFYLVFSFYYQRYSLFIPSILMIMIFGKASLDYC